MRKACKFSAKRVTVNEITLNSCSCCHRVKNAIELPTIEALRKGQVLSPGRRLQRGERQVFIRKLKASNGPDMQSNYTSELDEGMKPKIRNAHIYWAGKIYTRLHSLEHTPRALFIGVRSVCSTGKTWRTHAMQIHTQAHIYT